MGKHNKKTKKNNLKKIDNKTRLEKDNIEEKIDYTKEINLSNSEAESEKEITANTSVAVIEKEVEKIKTKKEVKKVKQDKSKKSEFDESEMLKEKSKSNKSEKKENLVTFLTTLGIALLILAAILIHKYDLIYKIKVAINPITITSINLELERTELEIGEELDVNCKITPENYTVSNFKWHSSDENIVEINNGKIIAKDIGKATIYLENDGIKSNEIEVEILVKLEDIVIENEISELQKGNVYRLAIKPVPENATYATLTFESDNSEILSVDNEGNLTANELGTATINIKNYKDEIIKSFSVEVKKIPVEKVEIDDTNITLGKGQSYILNAWATPNEATYKDIVWMSTDNNVVIVENRKLKAVGTGTAVIKAVSDNGEKEATCIVKVNGSAPNNTKRYANGAYNIRSGASTDYEILATTTQYEIIEFVKGYGTGWRKVRNSKGVVGYTLVKSNYYLSEKPVTNTDTSHIINNVPYLNQFSLGYPTGCEAVSATMVLKYHGYNVSAANVVSNTKNGSKKYENEEGKWFGANPFEEFVGSPNMKLGEGAYGVFAKPIASAMSVYAGGRVKNISGCAESQLFDYVKRDKPVVVWCVKNAGNLKEGVTWEYVDGSGSFKELVGEHCAVLIGYDENYVYLNDPSAGKKSRQSRSKFISNWKQLYSQAIVIE